MSFDPKAAAEEALRRDAGARALEHFLESGAERIEPPILQRAAAFLDMSGEEIRGRLYLTTDPSGEELCLRPDYTIPVCLAHLAGPNPAGPAQYAYLGPVFRARAGERGERIQTGLESYGRKDCDAADAEILALALEAAERAGSRKLRVKLGDVRVFDAVIDGVGLPPYWRRRVRRGLAQGKTLARIVNGGAIGGGGQSGVLAALERADHAGARALVEDLLEIAGIAAVGGREVSEIADRFLEQAAERADGGVGAEQQAILARFLGISGDPDSASTKIRALAAASRLDLAAALDSFDERTGFLAARGLDIASFRYDAGFVRDLDYYTGFVFEAVDAEAPEARPCVVGGRYDGLTRSLGADVDAPAVGAAIWVDRLPLAGV